MKSILSAALFLLSAAVHAQGLQLQVQGGGGMSRYAGYNLRKDMLGTRPCYEAGLHLQYRTKGGFTAATGLDLASAGYQLGPLIFEDQFDPATGTFTAVPVTLYFTYRFLRVPLLLGYEHKLSSALSAGIAAGPALTFLVNATQTGTLTSEHRDMKHQYSGVNAGISANLALRWKPVKRLQLSLLPAWGYTVFSGSRTYETAQMHTFSLLLSGGIGL
jgi:hypothetical protein